MNSFKNIASIIILTLWGYLSYGQHGEGTEIKAEDNVLSEDAIYIDSVKSWLNRTTDDTLKVYYLVELSYYHTYTDPHLAIQYGIESVELANKLNVDTVSIYANSFLAETYMVQGQYLIALALLQKTYDTESRIGHVDIKTTINNMGDCYLELNDYENAYKYFQEALTLSKKSQDSLLETISMFNIGRVYKIQGNFTKALEYIYNSKLMSEKIGDTSGEAYSYFELGDISKLQGEPDDAINFFKLAMEVSDSLGIKELTAQSMVKIADTYEGKNNFLKALEFYYKALKINEKVRNHQGIGESYLGLGKLQIKMNSMESALSSLHKGLAIAVNLQDKELESSFYEALSLFYEKRGNYAMSLDYYKQFKSLRDSVFNQETNMQVALLETQFDSEKKDKEIAQLNESRANQESRIQRQKAENTLLFGGLAFLCIVAVIALITIRNKKRANNLLRAQKKEIEIKSKQLSDLNRIKDKFFSIISHDLKSPFQSLSGILELMSMEALDDKEIKKLFKDLKVKFDSTNDLLENLLHWAKMQMKETTFDPDSIKLYDTIDDELRVIDGSKTKDIKVKNKVEELSHVSADINMLKLIIRNLVNNAIKFTKNKGTVEVLSEDMGDFVCIAVKDNGIGISEQNLKKLFDRESSFTTLGTELEKGTGLGLNLCKEFVELHGGKIWVESEEGKGSTFKFTLKKAS